MVNSHQNYPPEACSFTRISIKTFLAGVITVASLNSDQSYQQLTEHSLQLILTSVKKNHFLLDKSKCLFPSRASFSPNFASGYSYCLEGQ